MLRRIVLMLTMMQAVLMSLPLYGTEHPAREFRGVWLPTAWQTRFVERTTAQNQTAIAEWLDVLQAAGFNAVIFQVRPQADAFYESRIEPWSRHLTGTAGKAPQPAWDPLQYFIEQCHDRNMELHAWINPYRVTTSKNEVLPQGHIYYTRPELFMKYDGKIYYNPGESEARQHILAVVQDIVDRYDIDAIHLDDYFYPYPANGERIADDATYARYGKGRSVSDWRRDNVDRLIESLHTLLRESDRPWVRLGISPFGIYRNSNTWAQGSETRGLQCYDDLYADVLKWAGCGWIDYVVPQLYWTLQHEVANYDILVRWWNNAPLGNCHLYIGQHLTRSCDTPDVVPHKNQLERKIELGRYLDHVQGDCYWYGYQLVEEYRNVAQALAQGVYSQPAMVPAYTQIDNTPPAEVASLKARHTDYGYMLEWKPRKERNVMQQQVAFAVYRYADGEAIDLTRNNAPVTITRNTAYLLPYVDGKTKYTYVVTAIDHCNNESVKGKRVAVKL